MSVVPGGLDTEQQPPMAIPLRHFLLGVGFLLAGAIGGIATALDIDAGLLALGHVHLLLVGWICVTIMGAMTQFVPVWSGLSLHSRRLSEWQLRLVIAGLVLFVAGLATTRFRLVGVAAVVMLAGFWLFVYNIARTLASADGLDRTERHFAIALGFFVAVTALGVTLALDFSMNLLAARGVARHRVVATHLTLAIFGAVLTTVLGALYQLGTMFTQTELHGVDHPLARLEEVAYPVGVVALAAGRGTGTEGLALVGALLLGIGLAAFLVVLARKLLEMQVPWTPMHRRYVVAIAALAGWLLLALPAWLTDPLAYGHRFGAEGSFSLLVLAGIGFVVLGTLYHIVPFIVWVHRYSDLLGRERVPMVDDLYDDRLAMADLGLLLAGVGSLVASERWGVHPDLDVAGGVVLAAGVLVFAANLLLVVVRHSPQSLAGVLIGIARQEDGTDCPSDTSPQMSADGGTASGADGRQ